MRYDSEGDELDEDEEDSEADAAAAEENPFADIALESSSPVFPFPFPSFFGVERELTPTLILGILSPLKHPADLPFHPSMSHPYTSKALREMTRSIELKLFQERTLLWRTRNLHRQFVGDSGYMPCGMVETPEDIWNFTPANLDENKGTETPDGTNRPQGQVDGASHMDMDSGADLGESHGAREDGDDIEMTDALAGSDAEATRNEGQDQTTEPLKSEDVDRSVGDLPQHVESRNSGSDTHANGTRSSDQVDRNGNEKPPIDKGDDSVAESKESQRASNGKAETGHSSEHTRRRTTRTQKTTANPPKRNESSNNSLYPSMEISDTTLTPHPLFLVPDSIRPDPNVGLPPNEAEDTRRLLWSYIQKQEETVRGFERMFENLLRANKMKEAVWGWCKAEGHLGEMSDGEDWYDPEKWGLAPGEELKKGADEDEIEAVDESRTHGKRGRRRQ